MLETESSRQMFDPSLNEKTDSVFYAFGIAQAMQMLADQYVFQGEMRGDLIATTEHTDRNLRELANYSATTANKYDSAYVYYRVINNCNYYIAYRDTTLLTGATQVVMNEYAAVKAFRAWAYLQLAKNYGKVPFFTEPLTKISQIDEGNFPEYGINEIVAALAPDLAQYSSMGAPLTSFSANVGATNWGQTKNVVLKKIYLPVDVVLGDLYLEIGDYANAAHYYTTYLNDVEQSIQLYYASLNGGRPVGGLSVLMLPSDFGGAFYSGADWTNVFSVDVISYIPMAVNRLKGATTDVPKAFGYDYYSTNQSRECPKAETVQLQPSDNYVALSDSTDFYYFVDSDPDNKTTNSAKLGDMRLRSIIEYGEGDDSLKVWTKKYNEGNIMVYRRTAVWLRLAEAFNRMGHYDIAFAILKDGLSKSVLTYAPYLSEESKVLLTTTYPLLSEKMIEDMQQANNNKEFLSSGIHARGAGMVSDRNSNGYFPGLSVYQLDTIVGMKMKQIAEQYKVNVGTTKEDTINAMEDLICDECALDMAFEGYRFGDLTRMARAKNRSGIYDGNFGGRWFAKKLEKNNPVKDLSSEQNWYLPFK